MSNLEHTFYRHENPLSPQELIEDNHSLTARKRIDTWYEMKRKGDLILTLSCGDARVEPSALTGETGFATVKAIAAALSPERLPFIIGHGGVAEIVVLQHFDGGTMEIGGSPKGCGGLQAKLELLHKGRDVNEDEIESYIDYSVGSSDPVLQAYFMAEAVAKTTDKPVIAAATDHRSGVIYPFAALSENGQMVRKKFNLDVACMRDANCLYENGEIPTLDDEYLPLQFLQLMQENRRQVAQFGEIYPDFYETQSVQNPYAICVTTAIKPLPVRYPYTFSKPNTVFGLGLPFEKEPDHPRRIRVKPDDLREIINQLKYPITHAVGAQAGDAFFNTKTVVVETPDYETSLDVAAILVQRKWMQEWLEKDNTQILVAQINEGKTTRMEIFKVE